MVRRALVALPAATVLLVAFALLSVLPRRPALGARVYGGPTDGSLPGSFRLQVVEQQGASERPLGGRPVALELRAPDGRLARWSGALDPEGLAEAQIPGSRSPGGAAVLTVTAPGRRVPLAAGGVALRRQAWWATRRERGGPLPAPSRGALEIAVIPARGALAGPFASPLRVEVRRGGAPAADVTLEARAEGAELLAPAPPTNAGGRTRLLLRPLAHVAELALVARDPAGAEGRGAATLPIVPGALDAARVGGARDRRGPDAASPALELRSPVPRAVAYFAVVDERGRHGGGAVRLAPGADGLATGRAALPGPLPARGWVVVSGEPDLASPGAVGWPLDDATEAWLAGEATAPRSVTVRDALLLDGVRVAQARESTRQAAARHLTALLVALALVLELALLWLIAVRGARERDRALRRAAGDAAAAILPSRGRALLAFGTTALAVAFGFAGLGLFVLWRGF